MRDITNGHPHAVVGTAISIVRSFMHSVTVHDGLCFLILLASSRRLSTPVALDVFMSYIAFAKTVIVWW
jgi:hypothetical protein